MATNAVRVRYGMRVRVWIRAITKKSDLGDKSRKKTPVDGEVRFIGRLVVAQGIWGECGYSLFDCMEQQHHIFFWNECGYHLFDSMEQQCHRRFRLPRMNLYYQYTYYAGQRTNLYTNSCCSRRRVGQAIRQTQWHCQGAYHR